MAHDAQRVSVRAGRVSPTMDWQPKRGHPVKDLAKYLFVGHDGRLYVELATCGRFGAVPLAIAQVVI